jgi:CBS domain containing-hemolysin-like protein
MSLVVILVCLLLSAFFSGMEIAFITANRFKLEVDRKKGSTAAGIMADFLERPSRFISTMLVGNNIALVVYGISMATVLDPLVGLWTTNGTLILLFQTIIATLIVLITAEFTPKAFFRINPNRMLMLFAIPGQGHLYGALPYRMGH